MTFPKLGLSLFFISFLVAQAVSGYALDKPYDHSAWDQFLTRFVNADGQVDYRGVKENPELLNAYLKQLEEVALSQLELWPREEEIALWMNAYHAAAVKVIVDHYPVDSILDIPGAWEKKTIFVGGRRFSMNDIHRRKLMETFGDEKVHFALSCTAKSCPPFPRESFKGPTVEGQLYLAAKAFINNEFFTEIIPDKKRVRLSKIFEWHQMDFILDFGRAEEVKGFSRTEEAMLAFVAYYLDDLAKIQFLESRNYKVKYLKFDWALNEWQRDAAENAENS